jgi:hypothetical protein
VWSALERFHHRPTPRGLRFLERDEATRRVSRRLFTFLGPAMLVVAAVAFARGAWLRGLIDLLIAAGVFIRRRQMSHPG